MRARDRIAGAAGSTTGAVGTPLDVVEAAQRGVLDDIDEITAFGAAHQRDCERQWEIEELFSELTGSARYEAALSEAWHASLGRRRSKARDVRVFDAAEYRRQCAIRRERYARFKRDHPVEWRVMVRATAARVHARRRANGVKPRTLVPATTIVAIRAAHAAGVTQRALSLAYGLSHSHVSRVCRGGVRRGVGGPTVARATTHARGERNGRAKLSDAQREWARTAPGSGRAVARALGVAPSTVNGIRRRPCH